MSLRHLAIITAIVICVPAIAEGDDATPPDGVHLLPTQHVTLNTGFGVIRMPGGFDYFVPEGSHILQPDAYSRLDLEMRRLQESEVRLVAENKSMRITAKEWQPGWVVLLSATVVGVASGIYIGLKL